MSFRITFLNQKGGVGKSTAAALIGAVLQEAGYKVAVDDRDPQKTLEFWAREVGQLPLLGAVETPDVIITDTPGRLDFSDKAVLEKFSNLIQESQRIVLVSEKTLFSIHAAAPMVKLVTEIIGGSSKMRVLFNKVRSGTAIGKQDEQELARKLGVTPLKHHLPLASVYERMETEGLGAVTDSKLILAQELALELMNG